MNDWFAKRELPRLDLDIAVWIYAVPSTQEAAKPPVVKDFKDLSEYDDDELRMVQAMDISGGGMSLFFDANQADYINRIIDQNSRIGMTFFIPDPENPTQIRAISEFRWEEEVKVAQKEGKRIGLRFVRIKPSDRDVIVNWVIKKMIEKGLEGR